MILYVHCLIKETPLTDKQCPFFPREELVLLHIDEKPYMISVTNYRLIFRHSTCIWH